MVPRIVSPVSQGVINNVAPRLTVTNVCVKGSQIPLRIDDIRQPSFGICILGKPKANVRDVARHAGVSVATVSRVVNKTGRVLPDTEKRVRSAIAELNYTPSAAARAINSGRTRIVGALVPTLDNSIFAQFLGSLEEEFLSNGLSLVVATTENDETRELERAAGLIDIGVEGLIVSGITRASGFDELVQRTSTPVISTSYFDPNSPVPTIGYDNEMSGRMAAEYLIGNGHRNIAVFHGPTSNNDRTRARLRGVESAAGGRFQAVEMPLRVADAKRAVSRILDAATPPTAILALSDVLAHGALFGLQLAQVSVPQKVSIIGIDDLQLSAATVPGISTVHLPVRKMGQDAARALADWILNGDRPAHAELRPTLIKRGSVIRL